MTGIRVATHAMTLRAAQTELVAAVEAADESMMRADPIEGEWNAANILGHVTELQPHWMQKAISLSTPYPAPLTRTVEEHQSRNEAVELAGRRTRAQLVAALKRANQATLQLLESLGDDALDATGPRWDGHIVSADTIIQQHIVSHVAEHARQLSTALRAARVEAEV